MLLHMPCRAECARAAGPVVNQLATDLAALREKGVTKPYICVDLHKFLPRWATSESADRDGLRLLLGLLPLPLFDVLAKAMLEKSQQKPHRWLLPSRPLGWPPSPLRRKLH